MVLAKFGFQLKKYSGLQGVKSSWTFHFQLLMRASFLTICRNDTDFFRFVSQSFLWLFSNLSVQSLFWSMALIQRPLIEWCSKQNWLATCWSNCTLLWIVVWVVSYSTQWCVWFLWHAGIYRDYSQWDEGYFFWERQSTDCLIWNIVFDPSPCLIPSKIHVRD